MIINSLLCFLNSAKVDFSKETLKDVACAFYSHENIKEAKTTLTVLLKKDTIWRRDPEKKKKDLSDVVDLLEELTGNRNNYKFLCDSYKAMPPLGMEMIAPLIINLSTEVSKINETLPKVLDIKTEVMNTADTVRQLHVDINDVKKMFNNAVDGIKAASDDITEEDISALNDLRTFRRSLSCQEGACSLEPQLYPHQKKSNTSFNEMPVEIFLQDTLDDIYGHNNEKEKNFGLSEGNGQDGSSETVTDPSTGATSKTGKAKKQQEANYSDILKKPGMANVKKNDVKKANEVVPKKRDFSATANSARLRGARKASGGLSFKAVKRTSGVLLGRVHKEMPIEDI